MNAINDPYRRRTKCTKQSSKNIYRHRNKNSKETKMCPTANQLYSSSFLKTNALGGFLSSGIVVLKGFWKVFERFLKGFWKVSNVFQRFIREATKVPFFESPPSLAPTRPAMVGHGQCPMAMAKGHDHDRGKNIAFQVMIGNYHYRFQCYEPAWATWCGRALAPCASSLSSITNPARAPQAPR